MAAEDKNTRLKSNMTIAIYPATDWGRWFGARRPRAALVLSYLHWKAQKPQQGDHLKKAKPLDGLLLDRPSLLDKLRKLFRRRLTFGEIQRLEQRSRTRL